VEGVVHRFVEFAVPRSEDGISVCSDLCSIGPEAGVGSDQVCGNIGICSRSRSCEKGTGNF